MCCILNEGKNYFYILLFLAISVSSWIRHKNSKSDYWIKQFLKNLQEVEFVFLFDQCAFETPKWPELWMFSPKIHSILDFQIYFHQQQITSTFTAQDFVDNMFSILWYFYYIIIFLFMIFSLFYFLHRLYIFISFFFGYLFDFLILIYLLHYIICIKFTFPFYSLLSDEIIKLKLI